MMIKKVSPRPVWLIWVGALCAASCASTPVEPVEAAAPPEPAGPVYQLSDILGAGADDIDALLGEPALIRREGDGEFRRYGLKSCSLIVILYPDESAQKPIAAHVEATALHANEAKPVPETCLAEG